MELVHSGRIDNATNFSDLNTVAALYYQERITSYKDARKESGEPLSLQLFLNGFDDELRQEVNHLTAYGTECIHEADGGINNVMEGLISAEGEALPSVQEVMDSITPIRDGLLNLRICKLRLCFIDELLGMFDA